METSSGRRIWDENNFYKLINSVSFYFGEFLISETTGKYNISKEFSSLFYDMIDNKKKLNKTGLIFHSL